jgi:hypothetical protein
VDPRWRGQRARRHAHWSLASGRSGAPKLAGGGAKRGEEHGELGSGLTGARAALGGRRRRKKAAEVGRRGGEDTSDMRGPLDGETRERRPAREGANRKGKCISHEDATDAWTGWAGQDGFSLRGRRGRWAGWARGRAGRKVGRAESKEKEFPN